MTSTPPTPSGAETLRQRLLKFADDVLTWNNHRMRAGAVEAFSQVFREAADALAVAAQEPQGWQPMESAPKDGTEIIMLGPDGVDFGAWQDGFPEQRESGVVTDPGSDAGWYGYKGYWPQGNQPTRWMPLPSAPPVAPTGENR